MREKSGQEHPIFSFYEKTYLEKPNPFKAGLYFENLLSRRPILFFGKVLILIAFEKTISNMCDSREKRFY